MRLFVDFLNKSKIICFTITIPTAAVPRMIIFIIGFNKNIACLCAAQIILDFEGCSLTALVFKSEVNVNVLIGGVATYVRNNMASCGKRGGN